MKYPVLAALAVAVASLHAADAPTVVVLGCGTAGWLLGALA